MPIKLYKNRDAFEADLDNGVECAGAEEFRPHVRKAILAALSERDPTADICTDSKGNPEPDSRTARHRERATCRPISTLPLPIDYDTRTDNADLVDLVRAHCEAYFDKEVKPHWPDAWIDFSKTKVGYEIPINRHFYVYEAPRPLDEIEADIKKARRRDP